jgi:hypothetical protein
VVRKARRMMLKRLIRLERLIINVVKELGKLSPMAGSRGLKRIIMGCLMISLVASVWPVNGEAAPAYSDIDNHWAGAQIEAAMEKGYVNGFPDGTFKPDDPVTVAQFLTMMFLSFTDVKEDGNRDWSDATLNRIPELPRENFSNYAYEFGQGDPWYSHHVQNAKSFLVINDWEYEGRYDEALTRERAAKMVNVMAAWFDGSINDEYAKLAVTKMKDYTKFTPGWERLAAESMIRGILSGYPDGNFQPKRSITRAEAISVIERINNNDLRKPITVNLTDVPYSKVWGGYGYMEYVHVFSNWDMKKVYDQLRKDIQYTLGAAEQNGPTIYYFEDVETMNEGINYRLNPSQWYQNKVYIDMLIGCSSNTYNIHIAGMEGRFERRSDTLLRFLNLVFKEKGIEVHQLLTDSMAKHRKQSLMDVNKIIENRQVLVSSSKGGSDIMTVAISGYTDK